MICIEIPSRRRDIGMAEEFLNVVDVGPLVEQPSGKGSPQGVEYYSLPPIFDTLVEEFVDHTLKGLRDLLLLIFVLVHGGNGGTARYPLHNSSFPSVLLGENQLVRTHSLEFSAGKHSFYRTGEEEGPVLVALGVFQMSLAGRDIHIDPPESRDLAKP